MYIFVIFVHKICEEGREVVAINGLSPTYPPAFEVITKVGPECGGIKLRRRCWKSFDSFYEGCREEDHAGTCEQMMYYEAVFFSWEKIANLNSYIIVKLILFRTHY